MSDNELPFNQAAQLAAHENQLGAMGAHLENIDGKVEEVRENSAGNTAHLMDLSGRFHVVEGGLVNLDKKVDSKFDQLFKALEEHREDLRPVSLTVRFWRQASRISGALADWCKRRAPLLAAVLAFLAWITDGLVKLNDWLLNAWHKLLSIGG